MILKQGYIEVQAPCDDLMRTQTGGNPERQHCDGCGGDGVLIHDSDPPTFNRDKKRKSSATVARPANAYEKIAGMSPADLPAVYRQRHDIDGDSLFSYLKSNYDSGVRTADMILALAIELRRRFSLLPKKKVNGEYPTIGGHRSFFAAFHDITGKSGRTGYYLLNDAETKDARNTGRRKKAKETKKLSLGERIIKADKAKAEAEAAEKAAETIPDAEFTDVDESVVGKPLSALHKAHKAVETAEFVVPEEPKETLCDLADDLACYVVERLQDENAVALAKKYLAVRNPPKLTDDEDEPKVKHTEGCVDCGGKIVLAPGEIKLGKVDQCQKCGAKADKRKKFIPKHEGGTNGSSKNSSGGEVFEAVSNAVAAERKRQYRYASVMNH
jgi:hypothetical protein